MKRVVINKAVVRGLRSLMNLTGPTPEVAHAKAFLEDLVERFDEKAIEEHELTLEPRPTLEELVRSHVTRYGPASLFARIREWTGAYPAEGPLAEAAQVAQPTGLGIDELDAGDLRLLVIERDAKVAKLQAIVDSAVDEREVLATIEFLQAKITAMEKLHAESRVEADLAEARKLLADRYDLIRKQEAKLEAAKVAHARVAELEAQLRVVTYERDAAREAGRRASAAASDRAKRDGVLIRALASHVAEG